METKSRYLKGRCDKRKGGTTCQEKRREERRKGEDNVERDEWIDREKKLTQLIKATWMVKIKA